MTSVSKLGLRIYSVSSLVSNVQLIKSNSNLQILELNQNVTIYMPLNDGSKTDQFVKEHVNTLAFV